MKWQTVLLAVGIAGGIPAITMAEEESKVPPRPVSQWSCQEFLEVQEAFKPRIIYWVDGLNKQGRPGEALIDVFSNERVLPRVVAACQENPRAKFITRVRDAFSQ